MNHNLISEDAAKAKTVDLILKDGTVLPYSTDVKELAGTLAHEMIHQMGLTHSTDENGDDEQDDFVYEIGSCVKQKLIVSKEWYEQF